MNVSPIVCGPFEENCLIISSSENQAVVVDPGYNADFILRRIDIDQLSIAAYICTHGHMDHISALAALHRRHPAPVLMHSLDWEWAFSERNDFAPSYYSVPEKPDGDYRPLDSQRTWEFDGIKFEVIHTPGHTPGSVCIYFPEPGIMASGDTLFRGTCGRTDLDGGDPRQLHASLRTLSLLPDCTQVYPGHGEPTTIAYEKQNNYFMQ